MKSYAKQLNMIKQCIDNQITVHVNLYKFDQYPMDFITTCHLCNMGLNVK